MNAEFYEQASTILAQEPDFISNDLARLAHLYAKYANLTYIAADGSDTDIEPLNTILDCIRDNIIYTTMSNNGYFLNKETSIAQWKKSN